MKLFLSCIAILYFAMSHAEESKGTLKCTFFEGGEAGKSFSVESSSKGSKLNIEPQNKNTKKRTKIEARYSFLLNSVDVQIDDLLNGTKSISSDWFNEQGEVASASLQVGVADTYDLHSSM